MTSLNDYLTQYLTIRRSLGYNLSTAERILRRFLEFAEANDVDHITVNLFLQWKEQFGVANNNTWYQRLVIIRIFAKWLAGIDSRNEILPVDLIVGKKSRPHPYIFTDEEIISILEESKKLPSDYGLRACTCFTIFGLLAVTGLRINEALGLNNEDVDLKEAVLTIKCGKNRKSRFVPISNSTVNQLLEYQNKRSRFFGNKTPAFFLFEDGQCPTDCAIRYNFARVCQNIGLRNKQHLFKHGRGPRIHDFRHTFVVRTIIDWYRKGLDPELEINKLSTFLGHSSPEHTYWYIEAVPELLQLASKRAMHSLEKERY